MPIKKMLVLIGSLIVIAVLFAACSPTATETTEAPESPEAPAAVEIKVPFEADWRGSGHADTTAEAFNHWNEDDPAVVEADCAKCHSTLGIVDFLNDAAVDVPVGGVITCETCHNETVAALTSVTFPSGAEITGLGPEARCMTCHQGRESKGSVDEAIGDTDPDTVNEELGFKNIHYFAAGATLYGSQAQGGYEYDGKSYDGKFRHVEGIDTCLGCHNQHTLQVKVEKCSMCHEGVSTVEDLKNTRMMGSLADYDGDGDVKEGIASELDTLRDLLYAEIQKYAAGTAGTPIVYDPGSYPYFFTDTNANGTADADEANYGNKYATWTPRLLRAAYNYQVSVKDPGAFAHNAKYIIELVYDSIDDLGGDVSALTRNDPGHFAGNTEPFRHWDEDGEVSASCARCHSATGLPQYLKEGTNISNEISNGFMCTTCHNEEAWPERYQVASVTFPSGNTVSLGGKDADGNFVADGSNLCMTCHQGRESKKSVDAAIAAGKFGFKNIHYFAAGATLFGTEAQGAYEYDGKTYVGYNEEHPLNKCADCHDVHALQVKVEACSACHAGVTDPETIRMSDVDYDGDGDITEGIKGEIDTLADALYAELQSYAAAAGAPVVYDGHSYPYFFADTNGDGVATADEANYGNKYGAFDAKSLKAAFNYQYSQKDPGAFTHNPKYVIQFLIDSIADLGGNVSAYTRP